LVDLEEIFLKLPNQWPNINNLSGGLNLSRGLNMVVPFKIVSNVSRLKPALNLNRILADLNCGSNSLNFISEQFKSCTVLFN